MLLFYENMLDKIFYIEVLTEFECCSKFTSNWRFVNDDVMFVHDMDYLLGMKILKKDIIKYSPKYQSFVIKSKVTEIGQWYIPQQLVNIYYKPTYKPRKLVH